MSGKGSEVEDLMKTFSALEVERDYYRQVAERLGQKALTDAQDFSQMIRDLRQREIKLQQSQEKLEQTIEERTAELVTRNKELRESTLRYHSLVNRIPHGVYILRVRVTGAMQFEYLSPPLCQILDIDPEEFKRNANLAFSIAHPDDREELERSTREATDQRIPFRWEGRFIIRQDVRWIRIEADPATTPTGDIVWNGVLSDITEQRLIQEKLKESEERLNFLVKNSSDSLVIINSDGSQRYVSPAAERITGYPIAELEGRTIETLIHPDDIKEVIAAWNEAVEHPRKTVTVQYRHIHKIRGWVFSEAIAQSFLTEPAINGVIVSVRDITERKHAEEAIITSNKLLQTIINTAPMRIFYKNRELRYMGCNNAFAKDAGVGCPEDLIGKDDFQLAWKEQAELYQNDDLRVFESGVPKLSYDEPQTTPDGKQIWLRTSKVPLRTESNEIIGVLGTYEDITDRRQNEEALKNSLSLLEASLESTADGILIVDTHGKISRWNRKFSEMWMIPEDILFSHDDEKAIKHILTQLADPDQFVAKVRELYGTPEQSSSDQIKFLDGRVFERYSQPQRVEDDVVGRVWSFRDITERERAEEALRESERRYSTLFANQINGMAHCRVITDEHGRPVDYWILRINNAYERIIGIKKADIEGHRVREAFPGVENFSFDYIGVLGNIALEGGEINTEVFLETTGQNFILYAYSPLPGEFTVILTDITDRKKIERAILESEERLSSAAKAANFGVYSYDFDSAQAYYSLEFLSFYGLSPNSHLELDEDLAPKSLHPDDKSEFLEKMQAANDPFGSGILDHAFRIVRSDGQVRWLRVNGQTTFSGRKPSDRPLHANGIIQDITEGKRFGEEQRQWEKKRQQLQRAESLKTMAGAIAHHFNNQLAAVIGNLEMVIDDMPGDAENVLLLNAAMQGALNAVEVSGLMLTYLGQTTGGHAPLDLSDACHQSLPLRQAAIPKDVLFIANLPTPGPIINANITQIQQALTNLVTNAWEAAGKNPAVIDLTVKMVSPADIPATQRFPLDWQPQDLTYACMEVKDTSGGIAGEDIEKLFDPFFSSKFPGRGLGLPVALGIVDAHYGAVTVESKAGAGSTFRVYIPVSAEAAPSQPDQPVLPLAGERTGTVLLIEDEEIVRDMTQTMLARLGFKVFTARDGVVAVEIFRQHLDEIDIVLTDLSMPRMDGWETLSALRRIRPDIPVILASGHEASSVNAVDHPELPQLFLHKPYQKATLKDALVKVMEGLTMNQDQKGSATPFAGDLP